MKTGRSKKIEIPRLSNLIKVPYGVGTIPDPSKWEVDTVEDVIELCSAIVDVSENLEGVEFEWNDMDGWDYLAEDDDTINEFCDVWLDTEASDEYILPVFAEAVLREYKARPQIYSRYSVHELVEYWKDHYRIGHGHFIFVGEVVPIEPRVSCEEVQELTG